MKLIKQKKLYFSEGNSDKVYEVDLLESQDLFIVNFRYGRRGNNLREGTKTVFPVAYEEAEKIYLNLIASKEKKGYSDVLGDTSTTIAKASVKEENTVRKDTILKYLNQAIKGTYTRNWKVSKIIARVGVLEIKEAIPLIANFITSSDEFEQYNAISVLVNFNENNYLKEVTAVFTEKGFNTISGRIASAYILKFGNETDKNRLKEAVLKFVSKEEFNTLTMHFLGDGKKNAMLLYYAYLFSFDNTSLREELYKIIEKATLKVNTFKSIRYIYRTALVTNDITFLALISKRIAVSKAGYSSEYLYVGNKWTSAYKEKQKENPSIAFSAKTKTYFNKLSYKKVYELSRTNLEEYIKYATQVLCSLNDKEDNARENIEYGYNFNEETRRYENEKKFFPKYHQFSALMYVLYGNSTRFQQQKDKWFYIQEQTDTSVKEVILSEVWNTKTNEVLTILANGKSDIAIHFSLNIIKENPQFLENIPEDILTKLINHYHPEVLDLTVNILEEKYASTQAEEGLLLKLVASKNEKAIALGLKWLQQYEASYFSNASLVTGLLLSDEILVIDYLKNRYKDTVVYNTILSINDLDSLFKEPKKYNNDFLLAVNDVIGNTLFGKLLSATSIEKIRNLSASSIITNKLFAINLSKHNATPAYELFKETYTEYIASDEAVLRKGGIELLEHFPDAFLLENKQDIVSFCFSEYVEVRTAIRPTVDKLIKIDNQFKQSLLNKLIVNITEEESYEGLHQSSYEMLTQFFGTDLNGLSKEDILQLILSKYEFAQKLGTPIFEKRISLSSLTITELVSLAHSDILSIRESLHEYFKSNKARINYELETALLIFNTAWQDVIDWAWVYFDEYIDAKNWNVAMLLYVCDHVKEQVQAFGRSMVNKHFSEEKGLPLLINLQEHPTKGMQFFVTNYLDKYASDNVPVTLQLERYFKTTLFYINTNRATKTRVYAFLEKEAIKYKEVAEMTVRILTHVLDTKTITDKDKIIDLLLTISETHSDVEMPLLIQ